MPLLLLLKEAWGKRDLILVIAVVGLVALAKRQHEALQRRPQVEFVERVVEKRVIVRGPVRIIKDVVKAPDGTITTRTTTDRAAETVTSDKARDTERTEAPAASAAPSRYVGLSANPLDWKRPRIGAGLALGAHLDVGAYWDSTRKLDDGAIGAETRIRF